MVVENGCFEANYYLAQVLQASDPVKAYWLLIAIPKESDLFKKANFLIAHLLMVPETFQKRKTFMA